MAIGIETVHGGSHAAANNPAHDSAAPDAHDTAAPGAGPSLARVVGVPGAVLMGLGSILGTGIFVSIGIAAGVAGPSVVLAVVLAAAVATFNGLSSAQLAASHPVSAASSEYASCAINPVVSRTDLHPSFSKYGLK